MEWSATQYRKFEDERNRPTKDLIAQVPNRTAAHAADIGCGPGNSTELLQQRFPDEAIIGTADMVETARKRLPGVRFEIDDVAIRRYPSPFEVIPANTNGLLQWLPDHASLLPAVIAELAPGGSLAVQIPDNPDEPAHRLRRCGECGFLWFRRPNAVLLPRSPNQSAPSQADTRPASTPATQTVGRLAK